MPRGKLGAKTPRGTRQGRPLSDLDKECIRQIQMITQNKAETARQYGVTPKTVDTVLKKQPDEEPAVLEARRQSAVAIAGKVHGKVDNILGSIGPKDLESGHADVLDKDGKKIGQTNWGPSLLQKVTAGAIFIDKLPVLAQYEQAISADHGSGALPLPSDIKMLVSGIQSKIKSLSVLNVQFENDNPDLSQRAQAAIADAEIVEVSEPTPVDFDNPGVSNAGRAAGSDPEPDGVPDRPADSAGPGDSSG